MIIFRFFNPEINNKNIRINRMESSLNETAINFVETMFLLEPLCPQWMSVHKCHESQAIYSGTYNFQKKMSSSDIFSVQGKNIL